MMHRRYHLPPPTGCDGEERTVRRAFLINGEHAVRLPPAHLEEGEKGKREALIVDTALGDMGTVIKKDMGPRGRTRRELEGNKETLDLPGTRPSGPVWG